MKYKLLKNTPEAKAGTVMEENPINGQIQIPGTTAYYHRKNIYCFSEWFAPIDERWKPKHNEEYFVFGTPTGESTWWDDEIDAARFAIGNCFRTREEAESAALKVKELLLSLHKTNQP